MNSTCWLYAKPSLIQTMRKLAILMMFLFTVSIVPAFAQNTHLDEEDETIRAKIIECEDKVSKDGSLTAASKTVQKRNCSSEIRKIYAETALTHEDQDEMKIKLQNLQKCEDWYSQYTFLNEDTFKVQKNAQMVQSCIKLYDDPLWKYNGDDRKKILLDKLDSILVDVPIKNNFSDRLTNNLQYEVDKIYPLEKRIAALEDELDNKDMIIREQMNVIVNLANSLKNAIFNGLQFTNPFV